MKKYGKVLLGVLIALVAVSALLSVIAAVPPAQYGAKVPYHTFLEIEDLQASTWYVLVDLSDATNFPHARTNSINLKQVDYTGVLSDTTEWDVHLGVVGEVTTSTAHIRWIRIDHHVRNDQIETMWVLPEHGLNLTLKVTDTLMFVASVAYTDTAAVTTTTVLESPVTESGVVTTVAAAGDLVLFIEEVEAGGTIEHLSTGVSYDTQ